jgi:glycosyltransferase involved in cell wall biosynthesis
MRILLVHNYYQQPGGEDQVFKAEGELLERHGHEVHSYTAHNDQVKHLSQLDLAQTTIWNRESYRALRTLIKQHRPDIVHVHNTLPLISPAVYYAAKARGATVVQTLHNFRLLCPKATFFRDGKVCEDCLGKGFPWPAIQHACYRNSRAASSAVAAMLAVHRFRHTYQDKVDAYIALTEFARQKFIKGGLPADKIHVKGNFVSPDPGMDEGGSGYALFVGRLSEEKGIGVLLEAWTRLGGKLPLKIVGGGPLAGRVMSASKDDPSIEYLGWQPHSRVLERMRDAKVLIFPSLWYEGVPITLLEAFAMGLPVIASDLGTMASAIEHHKTGLLYEAGNADKLARLVNWALSQPEKIEQMRREARAEFEAKYTAEKNYQQLIEVYGKAMLRS